MTRRTSSTVSAGRERPLTYHLAILCLTLVMPILVLAALLAWYYSSSEYDRIGQRAVAEAQDVTAVIDLNLAGLIATTEVLALSRSLLRGDLYIFESQARAAQSRLEINVVLRDLDGQQLVNTQLPRGAPLPIDVRESDRVVLDTKMPVISDLFEDAVTRQPSFMVTVPVMLERDVTYLLSLSLPQAYIRDLVLNIPSSTVTIVDRRGRVIASTSRHDENAGQPLSPDILEEIGRHNDGKGEMVWDGTDEPTFLAFRRSQLSGWHAIVMMPQELHLAPVRRTFLALSGVAFSMLALAAGLAVLFARHIAQPVAALAEEAARSGQDQPVRPIVTPVREVNALSTILSEASLKRCSADAALRENEQRLRELQSELLHASRLTAMGELATALAHEINQPLGAANNFISAARLALQTNRCDGPARAVERLQKATEQMLLAGTILRRLRDFVARGEIEKRIVHTRQMVHDAVALASVGSRDPGLRLRIHFEPRDPPPVLADAIQIQQVIHNLVRNALEATSRGSRPREIVVETHVRGAAEVEIAVADSGPGLPAEPETLFRPFETTRPGGLGVGLSISRTIIEAHGGHLWAEPRPGGGAVFRFTLPVGSPMDAVDG